MVHVRSQEIYTDANWNFLQKTANSSAHPVRSVTFLLILDKMANLLPYIRQVRVWFESRSLNTCPIGQQFRGHGSSIYRTVCWWQ